MQRLVSIKENAKNIDVWTRGLFILVYGVIFYFLYFLIWLMVIFQFIMKLVTNELNTQLLDFSDSLIKYVAQILLYMTFKSEERPFPFSPWPGGNKDSSTDSDAVETKKVTSKTKASKKKAAENDDKESDDS